MRNIWTKWILLFHCLCFSFL